MLIPPIEEPSSKTLNLIFDPAVLLYVPPKFNVSGVAVEKLDKVPN